MKLVIVTTLIVAQLLVSVAFAQTTAADSVNTETVSAQATPTAAPTAPGSKAWHSGNYWGVGAQTTFPRSDFGINYETGYGIQGMFDYPLIPLIDLSGSIGWNHFGGKNDNPGIDIWELALGARFALGVFFMNGEAGYFTEVDEWNYIPGLGLRFDHWEYSLRTKVAGSSTWSTFRIGYYF